MLRQSKSPELTAAQHAAIRQHLALIPVYVWVAYASWLFLSQLPVGRDTQQAHITRDFVHFYAQAVITRERDGYALYDIDAMAAVVDRVVPVPVGIRFPPVYGPQVGLLFSPLAWLSYVPALLLWLGITLAGYAVCVYVLWRSHPALRHRRLAVAVLALGAPGLHFTCSFGQISLIGLVCFTVLWVALQRGKPFLAGLAVGVLAYKPPLGIVAACVFVSAREWRVVTGALASIALQFGAAIVYWGPAIFNGYVSALRKLPGVVDAMEPDKDLMHSWRSMFLHLGVGSQAATVASLVLSIAVIAVAVLAWRTRGALTLRFALLAVATLLVNPHTYAYDLLLLVPALMAVWAWVETQEAKMPTAEYMAWIAAFVYLAPLLTLALPEAHVQWSVIGFAILSGYCAALLLSGARHNALGGIA